MSRSARGAKPSGRAVTAGPSRFRDDRSTQGTFLDELLVHCPRCDGRATATATSGRVTRLGCPSCGFGVAGSEAAKGILGQPYTTLGPWLSTRCKGEWLFAWNARHLAHLEALVAANLRERTPHAEWGWSNRSMLSRLPRWMKLARNREAVLRGLARMRTLLEQEG